MSQPSLQERLREMYPTLTRAEKSVANYMLTYFDRLGFETAASIAENVGVSQMTVGRFLRTIGYNGLPELKSDLLSQMEAPPLMVSDRLNRIRAEGTDDIWHNFDKDVAALQSAYSLRGTPAWKSAIRAISTAQKLHVAGFQTIAGIASGFATRLSYLRADVRIEDGRDGIFGDILGDQASTHCVVLFEMRRYTQASLHLAAAAEEAKIPLIIVCDTHCLWARDHTDMVFPLNTESHLFWDSHVPYSCLSTLLLNDLTAHLGDSVSTRLDRLRVLQDRFGAFRD
ncbi:transcriptional regulator, RpiR family [Roseovarius nanhaiticus]|uniref:Transcriptional regulator, RpiR family n=1 Tax=Roseovarius nanhaiticus TaxID=573024 RepID=A0A1N7ESC0_9RHOB|nr:MurR/RpiR family transcriptional regulator [Roseovarius nanhaiticus]SEK67695.1 transcriptional regulator, RpiR family [Roseovarius nanhaiticus]SIR90924.1 transcriptional regulator, RpiR family [Roseovarius nanhaiticus]